VARGLKTKGHSVYIASSGGELVSKFIQEGIVYIYIPIRTKQEFNLPKILISLFKLLKFIKDKNIEIIHSNTRVTQVLGCLLQKFSGKPYISTCHGFFKRRISRKIFPCWGNKVIAISEAVRDHLIKDFGVKEEVIRVIYNGFDVNRLQAPSSKLQADVRQKLGLGDGPVVGIIARLSEEKGHSYLIEAMPRVIGKFSSAQLLIVGEGRMREKLVNLTRTSGLEKNVFFVPSVSDTQEVLSIMDLFVLPSLKEGLGLSLMEAMASGLAVIGSNVGGIKSLIRDGYNGLLINPGDTEQLADRILELLGDHKKRDYLGDNARIFIKQNFSLSKMAQETERTYLECLSAKD
jgi:glycosyltransferase involved in cell wall biosynthesis